MLGQKEIEKVLEHCEGIETKYESQDMCGDEGVPYFEFMRTQGWCEALRLVLGRNTLKTTKEESEG